LAGRSVEVPDDIRRPKVLALEDFGVLSDGLWRARATRCPKWLPRLEFGTAAVWSPPPGSQFLATIGARFVRCGGRTPLEIKGSTCSRALNTRPRIVVKDRAERSIHQADTKSTKAHRQRGEELTAHRSSLPLQVFKEQRAIKARSSLS